MQIFLNFMVKMTASDPKRMMETKYPNVLVVPGLDLGYGDVGGTPCVSTPYLLALRIEPSYYWNVSVGLLRKL